jgi:hypothetical protein
LKSGSDAENNTAHHDTLATTKVLAKDETEDGAEEATDLVNGDHGSLKRRTAIASICSVDLGKSVGECSTCQQARHNTLIITEEEEARTSRSRDGPVQGPSNKDRHDEECDEK